METSASDPVNRITKSPNNIKTTTTMGQQVQLLVNIKIQHHKLLRRFLNFQKWNFCFYQQLISDNVAKCIINAKIQGFLMFDERQKK